MDKTVIKPWLQTLVLDISLIAYEWIRSGEISDSDSGCESPTPSSETGGSQEYLSDTPALQENTVRTSLNGSDLDHKLENPCEASSTVDNKTSEKSKNSSEQVGSREDTTRSIPDVSISSVDNKVDFPDDLVSLREQILQRLNEVSSRILTNSTSDKCLLSAEGGIRSHHTVEAPRKVVVGGNAAVFRELARFVFPNESSIESLDRNCRTENEFQVEDEGTQTSDDECNFQKPPLVEKITTLEKELERRDENWKMQKNQFRMMIRELEERNDGLEDQVSKIHEHLEKTAQELRETLLELGRLSVENTMIKRREKLQSPNLSQSKEISTQTSEAALGQATSSESGRSLGAEALMNQVEQIVDNPQANVNSRPGEVAASSVKVSSEESSGTEGINLGHVPTNAVERSVYNNYKMLLLLISHRLLSSDIAKLKEWVNSAFSVNVSQDVDEIFLQLDRKGVISSSNLEPLGAFFERIVRIDLKHLIDCFLIGDYGLLRATNSIDIARKNRRTTSSGAGSTSSQLATRNPSAKSSRTSASAVKRPDYASSNARVADRGYSASSNVNIGGKSRSFFDNNSGYQDRGTVVADGTAQNDNVAQGGAVNLRNQSSGTEKTYSTDTANNHTSKSYADMGSNGNKLSRFQRTDSSPNRNSRSQGCNSDFDDDDSDSSWLCSHYKRRCHVKFSCCDQYWPCHRCHNNESKCGEKKLRSRDTKFIKCVNCGTEQEFSESSQFCANCNTKLAKYFCAICKHLTGEDDNPYHCEKCGICRIHRERSFHCDVCGVCLDVQLRGNHKCRAGSAHDECCICLEDAFTGCQILPCSHKVHKECATQMIRRGITRCPICRESFAHKLEKRPIQTPKKPTGKK